MSRTPSRRRFAYLLLLGSADEVSWAMRSSRLVWLDVFRLQGHR
jgi:hypothetical protein